MAGPEAAAMAKFFSQQPQSLPSPKAPGEVIPSEFEGLTATAVGDTVIGAAVAEDLKSPTAAPPKGPPKRGSSPKQLVDTTEASDDTRKPSPKKSAANKKTPPRRGGRKKKTT
jgi:hypothetical protein